MKRLSDEELNQFKADADMTNEDDLTCINEAGYCLQKQIEYKEQHGQAGSCRIEKIALVACEIAIRSLVYKEALQLAIDEIGNGVEYAFPNLNPGDYEKARKEYTEQLLNKAENKIRKPYENPTHM